jgi:hypothetical protein
MKCRTFLGATAGVGAAAALDLSVPLSAASAAEASPETPRVAPVASHATGAGDRLSMDWDWKFHASAATTVKVRAVAAVPSLS